MNLNIEGLSQSAEGVSLPEGQGEVDAIVANALELSPQVHPQIANNGERIPERRMLDADQSRIPDMTREQSAALVEKKLDISQKEGVLWECVDRTPGPHGGFIYQFKMKEEFLIRNSDEWDDKTPARAAVLEAASPAIELAEDDLTLWDFLMDPKTKQVREELAFLGYHQSADVECILSIPDKTALENGWSKLRNDRPSLPELKIADSKGIADDVSFLTCLTKNDVLVADGKEFMHDSTVHVLPVLLRMLDPKGELKPGQSYRSEQAKFQVWIQSTLQRLNKGSEMLKQKEQDPSSPDPGFTKEDIQKLMHILGLEVDNISTIRNYERFGENIKNLTDNDMQNLPKQWTKWSSIWEKEGFGVERGGIGITSEELTKLEAVWNKLK